MSSFEKLFNEKYNPARPTAFIVKLKRNDNEELNDLIRRTSFLDSSYDNVCVNQRLWHYVNKYNEVKNCPICKNPLFYRETPNRGYIKTCGATECKKKQNQLSTSSTIKTKYGVDNISQTKEWREKVKSTNLERRGVEWNTQDNNFKLARKLAWEENKEDILNKRVITNNKIYGCDWVTQNEDVKQKKIETISKDPLYHINRMNKLRSTCITKYGNNYFMGTPKFLKMSADTLYKKFGVYHNSHVSEVLDKRWINTSHKYRFPSNNIIRVQGYEPLCLDELLLSGYKEIDIIVGSTEIEKHIGKLTYITDDGKLHRYFPDIFIPSENLIIEVKSAYTLSKDINIKLKEQSVVNANLKYLLKIY